MEIVPSVDENAALYCKGTPEDVGTTIVKKLVLCFTIEWTLPKDALNKQSISVLGSIELK